MISNFLVCLTFLFTVSSNFHICDCTGMYRHFGQLSATHAFAEPIRNAPELFGGLSGRGVVDALARFIWGHETTTAHHSGQALIRVQRWKQSTLGLL